VNLSSTCIVSGVALIGEGGASSWTMIESEMDEDIELLEASAVADACGGNMAQSAVMVDSDSEEENVIVLDSLPAKQPNRPINLAKALKRRQK